MLRGGWGGTTFVETQHAGKGRIQAATCKQHPGLHDCLIFVEAIDYKYHIIAGYMMGHDNEETPTSKCSKKMKASLGPNRAILHFKLQYKSCVSAGRRAPSPNRHAVIITHSHCTSHIPWLLYHICVLSINYNSLLPTTKLILHHTAKYVESFLFQRWTVNIPIWTFVIYLLYRD